MQRQIVNSLPPGTPEPMASHWCHTVCEYDKIDFEWTIHDFKLQYDDGKEFESSAFPDDGEKNLDRTWNLRLDDEGIAVAYGSCHSSTCKQHFRVKTAIINNGWENMVLEELVVCNGDDMPVCTMSIDPQTINKKSQKYLVNSNLIIYCEIKILKSTQEVSGRITFHHDKLFSCKDQLSKDFEKLFGNMKYSDVTLIVGNHNFQAHKSILATRSPVFAPMFEHPLKENLSDVVKITDIEPDVFQEVLRYIYSGLIPKERMDEKAVEILAVADKYMLNTLKVECEDYLMQRMTSENCIKILALDDFHPATNYKKVAEDFLRRFPAKVMATDIWKKANQTQEEKPSYVLEHI